MAYLVSQYAAALYVGTLAGAAHAGAGPATSAMVLEVPAPVELSGSAIFTNNEGDAATRMCEEGEIDCRRWRFAAKAAVKLHEHETAHI